MNEEGYSWPEAVLTLTIVIVIFGTLLPFAFNNDLNVTDEKGSNVCGGNCSIKGPSILDAYGLMEGDTSS